VEVREGDFLNFRNATSRHNKELVESLQLLTELISIDSQTKNRAGVNRAQDFLEKILKNIGMNVNRIPHSDQLSGDLLVADYGGHDLPVINLICHVDTVLPPDKSQPFHINYPSNHITGSGVADDKAGVVIAIQALKQLIQNDSFTHFKVRLISSPSEEAGSIGWRSYFSDFGRNAVANLGLEPSMGNGDIIVSRNGNRWYQIKVKGKSSHAGRFGEKSINASHELSRMIYEFHKLNNYDKKIKLNVGSFSGGAGHYNITCGEAEAKLDVRYPCFSSRDQLHLSILDILKNPQCPCYLTGDFSQIEWFLEDDCPPLPFQNMNMNLVDQYLHRTQLIEERKIAGVHSDGAADINYFTTPTNFNLDGLGAVGAGLHTRSEYVEISSLLTRRMALNSLIKSILDDLSHHNSQTHEEFYITGDTL